MYVERQRKWIKEVGLEIGDKVLIVSSAVSNQAGWDDDWVDGMDETVGLIGRVESNEGTYGQYDDAWGIRVCTEHKDYYYPFFVLVKV